MVGVAGRGLTVTAKLAGMELEHPLAVMVLLTVTLPVVAPVAKSTVMVLVPWPFVMVAPAGTVQA